MNATCVDKKLASCVGCFSSCGCGSAVTQLCLGVVGTCCLIFATYVYKDHRELRTARNLIRRFYIPRQYVACEQGPSGAGGHANPANCLRLKCFPDLSEFLSFSCPIALDAGSKGIGASRPLPEAGAARKPCEEQRPEIRQALVLLHH